MLVSVAEAAAWVGVNSTEIAALTASAPFATVVRSEHRKLGARIPRELGDTANVTEVLGGPEAAPELLSGGLPGVDTQRIWLRQRIALADLVSVKSRTTQDGTFAALETDLTGYEVEVAPSRKLRRQSAAWPAGTQNLQVVYSAGFDDDTADASLDSHALEAKALLLSLIELRWRRHHRGGGDVVSSDGFRFDSRAPFEIFRAELADLAEVPL